MRRETRTTDAVIDLMQGKKTLVCTRRIRGDMMMKGDKVKSVRGED